MPAAPFDVAEEFANFAKAEIAACKERGVEVASQYLLPPGGKIGSELACHLLNPTFNVEDPQKQLTDDETSPTIVMLHGKGLSSENCFIFDQFTRRGRTEDVLLFANEDVWKPHRDFVNRLGEKMSAIVEICFGDVVWTEVEN